MAAASAVAESLPFDKQTTKSDLLRQLQQHEEESRAQKAREKSKIRSVSGVMSVMLRSPSARCRVHIRVTYKIHLTGQRDDSVGKGAYCHAW